MWQRLCLLLFFLVPSAVAYDVIVQTEYDDNECSGPYVKKVSFPVGVCITVGTLNFTFSCEGSRWGVTGGDNMPCDADDGDGGLYPDAGFSDVECVSKFGSYFTVEKDVSPDDNVIHLYTSVSENVYVASGTCMTYEDDESGDTISEFIYKNGDVVTSMVYDDSNACNGSPSSVANYSDADNIASFTSDSGPCAGGVCECSSSTCGVALEPDGVASEICGDGFIPTDAGTSCDDCSRDDCCDDAGGTCAPNGDAGVGTCDCAAEYVGVPFWNESSLEWDTSSCSAFGSLSVGDGPVFAGIPFSVAFEGAGSTHVDGLDWIGMYPVNQTSYDGGGDPDALAWAYTNGNASGAVEFTYAPAGEYKLVMFCCDEYAPVISLEVPVTLIDETCAVHDSTSTAVTCGVGFSSKDGATLCETCVDNGDECCAGVKTVSVTFSVTTDPTNNVTAIKAALAVVAEVSESQVTVVVSGADGSWQLALTVAQLTPAHAAEAVDFIGNVTNIQTVLDDAGVSLMAESITQAAEAICVVANALTFSDSECTVATCSPGFGPPSDNSACEACTGATWSDGNGACVSWTAPTASDCNAGEGWLAGNSFTNSECNDCQSSTWSDGDGNCQPWTPSTACSEGEVWAAGTASTDATCTAAPSTSSGATLWSVLALAVATLAAQV